MKKISILFLFALLASQCSIDENEMQKADLSPMTRSLSQSKNVIDTDVITVKLKSGVRTLKENVNAIRSNKLGFIDIAIPEGVDAKEYVSQLKSSGQFEVVEHNSFGEYCLTPNDSRVSEQWYINALKMSEAWNLTTGNSNIKIAMLDSGTEWTHSDLGVGSDGYSNIDETLGWNYESGNSNVITGYYHGTMMAGILGAKTNNAHGVAGVAGGNNNRGVTIIPYCVGGYAPKTALVDDAIIDAVDAGARVIQMSLSLDKTQASAVNAAINYAVSNNVVVVCAAGNNDGEDISYPAENKDVIAVGSVFQSGQRAYSSNYGSELDVVAPGVGILSTTIGNDYLAGDGTSAAAPHVSGIAALMLSVNPSLTGKQVRDIIEQTARKTGSYNYTTVYNRPNGKWNNEMGYGLVDAQQAVAVAASGISISGPERATPQTTVQYTIPATLRSGVTFAGWTITPGPVGTTFTASGTSTKTLNIQFLIPAIFELKANFRLSDGTTSFVSRQIDMTPLNALPTTPVLRWEQAQSYPYKVVLTNPQTGVTYNWQVSGGNIYYTGNNYAEITIPSGSRPSQISARCRSTNNHNGELSQWSDYLTISIPRGLVDGSDSLRVGEPTEKLLHI